MNRPIKFRAWTGYKMEYNVMVGHLGAFYCAGLDPSDSASLSNTTIYGKETPIMQFTGLLDKNGKEIWEGDILHYVIDVSVDPFEPIRLIDGISHVFWDNEKGSFLCRAENTVDQFCHYYSFEVIGNIYQNPELLSV